jgi:hypothetical protein
MTALDIRNGRMTREEADRLIREFEGKKPPSLEIFLEYLGMTEQEFNETVAKTVVAPHQPNFGANEYAPKTADFASWYRERK